MHACCDTKVVSNQDTKQVNDQEHALEVIEYK
jgi:hypothetical protein